MQIPERNKILCERDFPFPGRKKGIWFLSFPVVFHFFRPCIAARHSPFISQRPGNLHRYFSNPPLCMGGSFRARNRAGGRGAVTQIKIRILYVSKLVKVERKKICRINYYPFLVFASTRRRPNADFKKFPRLG